MKTTLDPIKLVIVEDEPISSAYLKKQLDDIGTEIQVIAELSNISDASSFFSDNIEYDLVFMDIHLEDGDCFKLLNNISIEKPIVFCTTFDSYAIRAFKYNSIDYLLKPVKKEELKSALKKYSAIKQVIDNNYLERMDKMITAVAPVEYKKRFLVRSGGKLKLVCADDVVCFYSDEGETKLIEKGGNEYGIDYTMERLVKLINPDLYFRINRKMCINIEYLHSVEDYFNNRLKIKMQKTIPFDLIVSRNRVKEFKKWLKG